MVTFQDIACELNKDLDHVRAILTENPDVVASEEEKDLVFETARDLGYDFQKLKIGKRMRYRKQVLQDLKDEILNHPDWTRKDILEYLDRTRDWIDRVTRRTFQDEFDVSAGDLSRGPD